jgi:hypothetical protein
MLVASTDWSTCKHHKHSCAALATAAMPACQQYSSTNVLSYRRVAGVITWLLRAVLNLQCGGASSSELGPKCQALRSLLQYKQARQPLYLTATPLLQQHRWCCTHRCVVWQCSCCHCCKLLQLLLISAAYPDLGRSPYLLPHLFFCGCSATRAAPRDSCQRV